MAFNESTFVESTKVYSEFAKMAFCSSVNGVFGEELGSVVAPVISGVVDTSEQDIKKAASPLMIILFAVFISFLLPFGKREKL